MARRFSQPTLKDVAELSGVSQTTASMALSGRTGTAHLSKACIARVQQVAKTLGYLGNYHSRTLTSGRSLTLGLAVGSGPVSVLAHGFWSPLCGGVESAARGRGYDVLLIGGVDTLEPLERALQQLQARRIDALIIMRGLYPTLPSTLLASGLPVVVIGVVETADVPSVQVDDAPGIEQAIAHLATLGHRQAMWVCSSIGDQTLTRRRAEHFRAAAKRHHLHAEVHAGEPNAASADGESEVSTHHRLLRSITISSATTALLCHNDALALGLYAVLAERGRSIPGDLSIIGFDDRLGDVAQPELTTISHSLAAMGAQAVELAIAAAERGERLGRQPRVAIPSQLVVRSSTAPARRP